MGSILENSQNSKPSSITSHDDDGDFMASFRNLGLENFHNSKPSSITSHDDDGDFMASFRNLGLENPHHSKPPSITSHDDYGDFMACLQNLGFIEFPGTSLDNNFGAGSSSFSVSSEQGSQKEDISYGGQVNKALGKTPVNSCVSETLSESPICQGNLWAYHNCINGGGYPPSYLHSHPTNNANNDLENELVTSPRTPLKNYSSCGPACPPNLSNQLCGTSLWDDQQACVYKCGMGYNISNGYNLYPTNGVSVGNGYNLHKNRGKSGGLVLDSLPEGVDLVTMAKTRNGSQILHRLLESGDKETRRRIFVEVFESIPESMIAPNGHHVFQKLMINSSKDNEFQMIVRKLTSENRFLIDASFDTHGLFSIQKFIKRLKKSPMASTVTSILSTSFFEMMTHPTARPVMYQCLTLLGVQPNKNTQKTKSRVRPSDDDGDLLDLKQYGIFETTPDDHGLDLLDLNQYGFFETSPDDHGLDLLDLKQYGFFETTPDDHGLDLWDLKQYGFFETSPDDHGLDLLDLEQYGYFETSPETTTSANNSSSSAQFESDDGTTKAPLNPISSNNTQTESKSGSAAGSLMGSTNYITCLNKDCYKCLSFMDISNSGSTCNLETGSLTVNVGDFRVRAKPEASTNGTESAGTSKK